MPSRIDLWCWISLILSHWTAYVEKLGKATWLDYLCFILDRIFCPSWSERLEDCANVRYWEEGGPLRISSGSSFGQVLISVVCPLWTRRPMSRPSVTSTWRMSQ